MNLGHKTILFGVHQFIIHPVLVLLAWIRLYKSFPCFKELFCIVIHDWGYWGKPSLKDADGDKHPELGAKIAERLFGEYWRDFILGHSSFYVKRNGLKESKLMAPDKYWHCMIPLWFYKFLSVPTGEFKHYRELSHARQVAPNYEPDEIWWANLQKVCLEKVKGCYKINIKLLD
jgi:hypothetical protein